MYTVFVLNSLGRIPPTTYTLPPTTAALQPVLPSGISVRDDQLFVKKLKASTDFRKLWPLNPPKTASIILLRNCLGLDTDPKLGEESFFRRRSDNNFEIASFTLSHSLIRDSFSILFV